jgi:hypothetical protein
MRAPKGASAVDRSGIQLYVLGSAVNRRPGLRPDKNGLVGGFPASQNLEMS